MPEAMDAGRALRRLVVVTAVKDEYDQLLCVSQGASDDRWNEGPGLDDRLVGVRRFNAVDGSCIEVVATWATEMGGVAASSLATLLVERYRPDCLAMCGICAGRRGKVSLGDVIFGERLWTYDAGKIVFEKGASGKLERHFYGDMHQYRLPDRWKQRIESYKPAAGEWQETRPQPLELQARWLLLQLLDNIDAATSPERSSACPSWSMAIRRLRHKRWITRTGLRITRSGEKIATDLKLLYGSSATINEPFRVHLAPIATGNPVVEDPHIFTRLSNSMRKVLGLEMEASAIAAVGELRGLPTLVTKAVADFADGDKDDSFRQFAARASAECLIGFIRNFLPELIANPARAAIPATQYSTGTTAPPSFAPAPNLLPRDVATFTGRVKQIERMVRALQKTPSSASGTICTIEALDGMPGIGKTALAVHVAHKLLPSYPDAQLFIDLHGYTPGRQPLSPEEALDRLLRALDVPASRIQAMDIDELASIWRSEIAQRRALIVLDNAWNAAQVRPLLPGTSGSCVIVTSRQRLITVEGAENLSLDVLPKRDAVELFIRVCGKTRVRGQAKTLAALVHKCGYLPLAIQITAGRWKHRATWTLKDLLHKLSATKTQPAIASADFVEVASAFELSYQNLSQAQRTMFRRLGLFPGAFVSLGLAASLVQLDSTRTAQLLDALFDQSLLLEPTRGRYVFHDLLREYAETKAHAEENESVRSACKDRIIDFYKAAAHLADQHLEPVRSRPLMHTRVEPCAALVLGSSEEAVQWFAAEKTNIISCIWLAADLKQNANLCDLAQYVSAFLLLAGHLSDACAVHEAAVLAARASGNSQDVGTALVNLGEAHRAAGDFAKAVRCFKQALVLRGPSLYVRAKAFGGMGFALERTGKYAEALTKLKEALGLYTAIHNAHGKARTQNSIGAVHWRLRQYDRALSFFRAALRIVRRIGDRYGEAHVMNNIGFTYQRLSKHKSAVKWLERSLSLATSLHDRQSQVITLNNLGYTLAALTQFSKGFAFAAKGLEEARAIGALYEQGRAYDAMARCIEGQGEAATARQYRRSALSIFEAVGVPEADELRSLSQVEAVGR